MSFTAGDLLTFIKKLGPLRLIILKAGNQMMKNNVWLDSAAGLPSRRVCGQKDPWNLFESWVARYLATLVWKGSEGCLRIL